MVQGNFYRGRIKVGGRRRRDARIRQIACMQISVGRVLHQKAVTRHRWFSSITEQRFHLMGTTILALK
ncbi:hypothetical protein Hanom_Chr17g01571521 [Helianthus anomalus]